MTTTAAGLGIDLFSRVLGADEDEPPDKLVRTARSQSWALPALLLSAYARDGRPLGSGSADELRRAKNRKQNYAALAAALAGTSARIVKGPSLARHYPEPLVRPVGDLDVVVPDEAELWRVVRTVLDNAPVETIDVSVFGYPEAHLLVQLEWPGEDPMLDVENAVEVCTAGFTGAQGPVRVRAELPAQPVVTDLLALAEERFQRGFKAKDVIDIAVLGQVAFSPADVVAAAERWQLAPELLELLDLAGDLVDLGLLGQTRQPLRAAAERELDRRENWSAPTIPPGADAMTTALVEGRSVGGLLLRETRRDTDPETTRLRRFGTSALLATPVGDYLLVDHPVVTPEQHADALAALAAMDGEDR
ncbi:nucleotidyltransferase family protein [Saccharothrix luteola]|uniref:nucleotidyltransferase family protein n=1 Tax=Saccharothrix luteola TaxID=2893018 RepID=UPI001E3D1269|nr:nucleotidyltransferase family protein [Saccharothrix luteola]MCC8251533.1 nucleotidyltransferase family protein [Saccharothrix luteola]